MSKQENKKIELYLAHGTLGSGKTSFISHLAKSTYFKNSYIIENEFANHNIDKEVLGEYFHNDIIDISGGCVCCSTGNELIDALNKIAEVNLHHHPVILETTGVANSVQLLKRLFLNSGFNQKFQLKRNVLIIDLLENSLQSLQAKVLDISLADTIILNKVDLVENSIIKQADGFIRQINNEALILKSIKGAINFKSLINSKLDSESFVQKNFGKLIDFLEINHEQNMSYEILSSSMPRDKGLFETKIKSILQNFEVLRIKGNFKDLSENLWHIEATKHNLEITPAKNSKNLNIVIIGSNIKSINL